MRAILSSASGPQPADLPCPVPGPGEVLVKVCAAGLNRADLAAGVADPARVPGMEWAGLVVLTGPDVRGFAAGDEVMCSGSGGYAEFAVADARRTIALKGTGLSLRTAGTLPLALMTAHDAVIGKGALRGGQTILVQGAGTAIGLMALQIARNLGAGRIFATARDATRRRLLGDFGASDVFDPADPDLSGKILYATQGRGVDLVVDMLSGDTLNHSMAATAIGGQIVNVGRLAGNKAADFDCDLHAARQLRLTGVTFRSRTAGEIGRICAAMVQGLMPDLQAGRLSLPLSAGFPLEEAAQAHAMMRSNAHFGKIVLIP